MIIPIAVTADRSITQAFSITIQSIHQSLQHYINVSDQDPVEAVHQIRKKIKLYRAFLKLIKSASSAEYYSPANQLLRDTGRLFSDLRDAHVRNIVIDDIINDPVFKSHKEHLKKLKQRNQSDLKLMEDDLFLNKNVFNHFDAVLNKESVISDYINSFTGNFESLYTGLVQSYKKGYQTYYSSYLYPSAEMLHEWRKRIKDLQYQFDLLFDSTLDNLLSMKTDMSEISELLGKDQDINNMIVWINQNPEYSGGYDSKSLISSLKSQRNKFKSCIDHLGKSIFSDDPEHFQKQLFSNV
jgi:CHAD domain-containing protein